MPDIEKLLTIKNDIVRDAERIYLLTELVEDIEKYSKAQTLASLSNELAKNILDKSTELERELETSL